MKKLIAALTVLLACFCSSALAQNLVVDPSFELGGAAWTTNGNWDFFGPPNTGAVSAETGCVGSACITTDPSVAGAWFYQDIPTTPGATYTVSFFYETSNPGDTPVELQVFFGTVPPSVNAPGTCTGTCIFDTQAGTAGYVQVTRTVVATGATTRLEFLGRNDPAGIFVDDVSVVLAAPAVPAGPVPTLSEWSLLMLAVLVMAGASVEFVRRRA
jgi:IPTL-CTERM motif